MQIEPIKIGEEFQVNIEEVFEITGTSYADLNITLMNQALAIRSDHGYQFVNTIVHLIAKNVHQQLTGSIDMNRLDTNELTLVEVVYDREGGCWHLTERGEAQLRGVET